MGQRGNFPPFGTGEAPNSDPRDEFPNTTGWISGSVRSTDGQSVQDVTITVRKNSRDILTIYAAPDGSFEIARVPTGDVELIAKQGLNESSEHISVMSGSNWVHLTLTTNNGSNAKGAAVTAAQLAVPPKARRDLEKAQDALHRKRLSDATRLIQRALVVWPHYAEALLLRAVMERQANSPQLAAADAEQAVGYDPNFPPAYFVLGSVYNDLDRSDDAIRTLDHGIAIGPTYWQGYYEMSRALLRKGEFPAALRQAEHSSSLAPKEFATIHLVKGYAYLGMNNPSAARPELETYVKMKPDTQPAIRAKAVLAEMSANGSSEAPSSKEHVGSVSPEPQPNDDVTDK
jgi:tetratricopeptide (TPR) repeat protein